MSNIMRVALPGYNALTDTNLDHFSLYTDQDNVLVKEFIRGGDSLPFNPDPEGSPYIIEHNLGYVPMFFVFVRDNSSLEPGDPTNWKLVPHLQSSFTLPPFWCYADESNIYIINQNYGEDGSTNSDFKWYVFYDNMESSGDVSLPLPNTPILAITKSGFDVLTENNPNNYIYRSDLNTFKILKEETVSVTYTVDGLYTISHGIDNYHPTSYLIFIQFPDGKSALIPGRSRVDSRDGAFYALNAEIDNTNIMFTLGRLSGSGTALKVRYLIFESPLGEDDYVPDVPPGSKIVIAKPGFNALVETNPNNLVYSSDYNTLKYSQSGAEQISIVGDNTIKQTEITIPHNLGYTPVFIVYASMYVVGYTNNFNNIVPRWDRVSFGMLVLVDDRAEAWADNTNIYLRLTTKQDGETLLGKFNYKIFKNNLGF